MQIEPIDLRLPSKVPVWLWYANGLLFVLLLTLVWASGFWHDEAPLDEVHVVSKSVVSDVPAKAVSAASTPETKPQALDWDAVLTGLEKVQATGVAVDGFTIDAPSRTMRLTLSFDTYEHLAQYLNSPHLQSTQLDCRLESAEMMTEVGAGLPGRATVGCK